MVKIAEKPYKVLLRGMGNPDHRQYVDIAPTTMVECDDLAWCKRAVSEFIHMHELGGGNWGPQCGKVFHLGEYIGRISYNGRFWDKDTEYGKPREDSE